MSREWIMWLLGVGLGFGLGIWVGALAYAKQSITPGAEHHKETA